jgi:dTMP kinase
MAYFITFEGGEGSGKSTQIGLTGDFLKTCGVPFLVTEEPGGTLLGKRIREILLNRDTFDIAPMAELLLFQASRYQHVETVIRPALQAGKLVLCDRFTDATVAYQGFGRGIARERIRQLNDIASASLKPDKTFLFDVPVELGLDRASRRMDLQKDQPREDRFEQEALAFHQRVRDGYRSLAREEPDRFILLDGTKDISDLHGEIRQWFQTWMTE